MSGMSTTKDKRREKTELIARLRRHRLELDWTLQRMADAIGISVNHLWKLENGLFLPNDRTAHRIGVVFPAITGDRP